MVQEAKQTLDDLKVSLERVTEKMNKVAEFFCLDIKKCKLEELFTDLLNFLRELENAQKVIKGVQYLMGDTLDSCAL